MDGQPPDTTHDRRQHGLTGATALHRWPALLVVGLLAIFGLRAPEPQNGQDIAALQAMTNTPVTIHQVPLGVSNAYLLESDASLVLVDAGLPGSADAILAAVDALGKPPTLIYITHAHVDHYGSANAIRAATGAPIAVHQADAATMAAGESPLGQIRDLDWVSDTTLPLIERAIAILEPTEPDIILEDGDRLDEYGLDGYVLHTPGHTPGSSTLIVDDQYAFAGDLVSATGSPHAQNSYAFSWLRVAESLARLQELDPTLTFAGHGTEPITAPELESLSVQFGDRQLPATTDQD